MKKETKVQLHWPSYQGITIRRIRSRGNNGTATGIIKSQDRCTVAGLGEAEYNAVKFSDYFIGGGSIIPEVETDDPPTSTKIQADGSKSINRYI